MLVIGRRIGEIAYVEHLGETLEVMLVRAGDGHARLGFHGPKSFAVHRVKQDVPALDARDEGAAGVSRGHDAE